MPKPLCLVTGACGFVGGHMVEVLHARGYPVRATDVGSGSEVLERLGVELMPADLTDPSSFDPVVRNVRYCFHCAAQTRGAASFDRLEQVNYDGTRELVTRLLSQPSFSKIVLWGDAGIYDGAAQGSLSEHAPIAPADDYLRTKFMVEQLVADYGQDQGLRYSVLRPGWVYGPRGVRGVGRLLRMATRGPVAMCPSNWQHRVPLVHVRDLCEAALWLAEEPASDGQAFNVVDSSELSLVALMRCVAATVGKPFVPLPPVNTEAARAVLAPAERMLTWLSATLSGLGQPLDAPLADGLGVDRRLSNDKLLGTGFELRYPDAREGLDDTVLWYQRSGWS